MNDVDFTAWFFVAAALMLWLGWTLLPVKLGAFFDARDFPAIRRRFHTWIWLYRVHLFAHVVMLMAFVALGSLLYDAVPRVLVGPAVAVLAVASIVAALAHAFYYHFGAWGAIQMARRPDAEVQAHVNSLTIPTEYATCLVRFGRVFFGLGQVVLAIAVWNNMPFWLVAATLLLGIAAMTITMVFPDNLEYYSPLFHLNAAWLAAIGVMLLASSA